MLGMKVIAHGPILITVIECVKIQLLTLIREGMADFQKYTSFQTADQHAMTQKL